jgi:hypothetical protein
MPRPGVPLITATKTGKQAAARKRQPSKKRCAPTGDKHDEPTKKRKTSKKLN